MAAGHSAGGQSPTALTRTLERVFDDAQYTGEILLGGRKLKEYPKLSTKYDLADTTSTDLSKNRFTEMPTEVCEYQSMERLNCYHNVIRCIPEAIVQLQALTYLNLSRNQLCNIPPFLCHLQSLEVLLASNNKLVSLPEEIGQLDRLMDLDVSCNEITCLPSQMGDMESLRNLNVRRNLLVELPVDLHRLRGLHRLDISGNKISTIPREYRKIELLEEFVLDNNPLVSPPAHICTKGRVHIFKYLHNEAIKEDRKRGILSEVDMRMKSRKAPCIQQSISDEFRYAESPKERRKRHTVDSGYSTTDSSEKSRWSPSEAAESAASQAPKPATDPMSESLIGKVPSDLEEANTLAVRAAETVKEQRQEREAELQRRIGREERTPPAIPNHDPFANFIYESEMNLEDEFTRELQRQKSEYENKKKAAERLRIEKEEEEEREQRRRMALRLQEEQKAVMEKQREEARRKGEISPKSPVGPAPYNNYNGVESPAASRRLSASQSFKEDRGPSTNNNYRRTVSDSYMPPHQELPPEPEQFWTGNNGVLDSSSAPSTEPSPNSDTIPPPLMHQMTPDQMRAPPVMNHSMTPEEEFRVRHESMIQQQRREAQMVRRRLEEEKHRIKQIQKEALYSYINNKRAQSNRPEEEEGFSFSRDSTPNTSFNGSTMANFTARLVAVHNNMNIVNVPKVGESVCVCQQEQGYALGGPKALEELNNLTPGFTIRRHWENAKEETEQIEQLRGIIECRLKVKLPDDLPAALKDGVVLCHLANHIRPRSVSSIHVPSPAVPKLTTAKCRKNVENFLDACRKIGVDQGQMCSAAAVLEEKGLVNVAITVQALVNKASNHGNPKQSAV